MTRLSHHSLDLVDEVGELAMADVDLATVHGGRNYTDRGACAYTKPTSECK